MTEHGGGRMARLETDLVRVLADDAARGPGEPVIEQLAVLTTLLAKMLRVFADMDGTPDRTLIDMHVAALRDAVRLLRQREPARATHPAPGRTH